MDLKTLIVSAAVSVGGASGITFALIKAFGNKVLEAQFEKSLETFKFRINSKFDRISKIHEKEFEVLPLIWNSILETNTNLYSLTSQLQEYPNIAEMNDLQLQELYVNKGLSISEIDRIAKSSNKMKEYIEIDYWKKLNSINKSLADFDKKYHENRIFLTAQMDDSLKIIRTGFIDMTITLRNANNYGSIDYKFKMTANTKQEEIDPYINAVGKLIQERLCFQDAY